MIQTFRELKVWQKAHNFTLKVYEITAGFPKQECFGLTKQIRSSAVSVAANIVEGHKRKSRKDFSHFLNIAEGSLEETKYYILLSFDLKYIDQNTFNKLLPLYDEIGRMLFGLRKSLLAER